MIKIRLARFGRKGRPFFRIVAIHSKKARDGMPKEYLGYYNPLLPKGNSQRVLFKKERVEYWLSNGAVKSDVVNRLWKEFTAVQ